jgi:hypothetical protein
VAQLRNIVGTWGRRAIGGNAWVREANFRMRTMARQTSDGDVPDVAG